MTVLRFAYPLCLQKSELEAACVKSGLPKSGNVVDLMLRLAVNKIPRSHAAPLGTAAQNVPNAAPAVVKKPHTVAPSGKKPVEVGDLVRISKTNDSFHEEFGKVVSADKVGTLVRFTTGYERMYTYADLMQCTGRK